MYARSSLWESETNFFTADSYFSSLLKSIDEACYSIYLETYIFNNDHLGKRFIDALASAKNRGVDIRLLVDGIGSMDEIDEIMDQLLQNDIPFKIYHPLPWSFRSYHYAVKKGRFFEKLLHFTGHINHRDHRKLCIIDSKNAWTGSFNISSDHLDLGQNGKGWKDHGLMVSGTQVSRLNEEFLNIWDSQKRQNIKPNLPFILSSLNPVKRKYKIKRITDGINQAKKRIWIANAYFAPHHSIASALIKAKNRGVDVRILVSGKSDIFFFPNLTRSFYADLLNAGVKLFEWHNSVLHSKIVLIDHYCYSGSSNLNSRSHYHDLELDILVCLEKTIKEIEQQFDQDFSQSTKVERNYSYENSLYIYFMSLGPRLLRYWL